MPSTPLILIGGGGHSLVVAEAAVGAGFALAGFYDDDAGAPAGQRLGLACLGTLPPAAFHGSFIVALGNLALRERILAAMPGAGPRAAVVVSAAALVSSTAAIGAGAFVGARATVNCFARLGPHCIINTGAIVEHECEIGENVHIAPGAVLGGNVRVGRATLVGLGAVVKPGVRIGERCTVGAGAVVVRDVGDGETVVGVPAAQRATRSDTIPDRPAPAGQGRGVR